MIKRITFLVTFMIVIFGSNALPKILLSVDKDYYFTGDYINIFSILEDFDEDQLVYLHIKDREDNNLITTKSISENGIARFKILIPENWESDYYEVIVYTNWLRNFGEEGFGRKLVRIYNQGHSQATKQEINANIYVEGNQLVAGHSARLVISARSSDGIGKSLQGGIISEKGDTVSVFKTGISGLSSVFFTPRGQNYKAFISTPAGNKRIAFPEVLGEGTSLSVRSNTEFLDILVRHKGKNENVVPKLIEVYSQGSVLEQIPVQLSRRGEQVLRLSKKNLSSLPYIEVRVLDRQNDQTNYRIVSLRSIREKESESLQFKNSVFLDRIIDRKAFKQSISCVKLGDPVDHAIPDLFGFQYFYQQQREFMNLSGFTYSEIEDFLITCSSFKDPVRSETFHPVEKDLNLKGKLVTESGTVPDSTLILFFVPGYDLSIKSYVGTSGEFALPLLFDVSDSVNIMYFAIKEGNEFDEIAIKSQFEPGIRLKMGKELPWNLDFRNNRENFRKRLNIRNNYQSSQTNTLTDTLHITFSNFDFSYDFDEYYLFPTMEETIKEIISGLRLVRRKGEAVLQVFDKENSRYHSENPLIFIEGVPTANMDRFLEISPALVDKIDLIGSEYFLQISGFEEVNGIINISLKKGVEYSSDLKNYFSYYGLNYIPETENLPPVANTTKLHECPQDGTDLGSINYPGEFILLHEGLSVGSEYALRKDTLEIEWKSLTKRIR